MSWRVPGQAIRVVIHDSDGGIGHYSRDQDDDGRVIWRGAPRRVDPRSLGRGIDDDRRAT